MRYIITFCQRRAYAYTYLYFQRLKEKVNCIINIISDKCFTLSRITFLNCLYICITLCYACISHFYKNEKFRN